MWLLGKGWRVAEYELPGRFSARGVGCDRGAVRGDLLLSMFLVTASSRWVSLSDKSWPPASENERKPSFLDGFNLWEQERSGVCRRGA